MGKTERVLQNLGLTLCSTSSLVRVAVVRAWLMKNSVPIIYKVEEKILKSGYDGIKEIYLNFAEKSRKNAGVILVIGWIAASSFFLVPIGEELAHPELFTRNNDSIIPEKRLLAMLIWYPFDTNKYYKATLLSQIYSGFIANGYIMYVDGLMYGLMLFAVGQLKILQHILTNFRIYQKKVQSNWNLSDDVSEKTTFRICCIMHKDIISYVEYVNESLKWAMLLDFLVRSIQLSLVIFEFFMFASWHARIHSILFTITMVLQMFQYYWNANEIILESKAIADSIYEGEWYNLSEETKQGMKIMMMRSQKPLTIDLGPFFPMSTDTIISILKGTYSYGMLLLQSYK